MKRAWTILVGMASLGLVVPAPAVMDMEWAYHACVGGEDGRTVEAVPGERFHFLNTSADPNGTSVVLYLVTANQFSGDAEEEVWVRWWNGTDVHWVQGSWVKNVDLGEEGTGPFRDQPGEGTHRVDLWKVEVTVDITRPGDNHYVIQLKGGEAVRYLLRETDVEIGGKNNLGQAWTSDEASFFGRDWKLVVLAPAAAEGENADQGGTE